MGFGWRYWLGVRLGLLGNVRRGTYLYGIFRIWSCGCWGLFIGSCEDVEMGKSAKSVSVVEEYLRREFPKEGIDHGELKSGGEVFNVGDYQLVVSRKVLRKDPDQVREKLEKFRVAEELRKAGKFPTYLEVCEDGVRVMVRPLPYLGD